MDNQRWLARRSITTGGLLAARGLGGLAPLAGTGTAAQVDSGEAQNVIFYLGDGMGQVHRDAEARFSVGAYGRLAMDQFRTPARSGRTRSTPRRSSPTRRRAPLPTPRA